MKTNGGGRNVTYDWDIKLAKFNSMCSTRENVGLHWNLSCKHPGVRFKLDMLEGKEARKWRGTTHCSGNRHHNTHTHGMPLADQNMWKQLKWLS